jgi:curved DNA-binding protein CbpA
MEDKTHYDVLGLRPNASHRQVVKAFAELAERYQKEASDPVARERFQQVKAAYQTLTNYESRLRYNIERGLPDPPKHGKHSQANGAVDGLVSLIPGNWYIYAFGLVWLVLQVAWLFERGWMWDHAHAPWR